IVPAEADAAEDVAEAERLGLLPTDQPGQRVTGVRAHRLPGGAGHPQRLAAWSGRQRGVPGDQDLRMPRYLQRPIDDDLPPLVGRQPGPRRQARRTEAPGPQADVERDALAAREASDALLDLLNPRVLAQRNPVPRSE